MGTGRFRPWRKGSPPAAAEQVPPRLERHIVSVTLGPRAVAEVREAVAERFVEARVDPASAFADAVLLAVSELVTNVLRHASCSPVADVGITVGAGQLVIGVADTEPALPSLGRTGGGLAMVAELAATYGGAVSVQPAVGHEGKVVLVRFEVPS
ncbi:ATP-binding protein [Streptomyces sp. NPDC059063]|uniref:ATP-binding protein n=1 Tax=unclassified Streptomyces TaxID=2593676 RepID=UPI003696BC87